MEQVSGGDLGRMGRDFWREAAAKYLALLRGAREDEPNPVLVLENLFLTPKRGCAASFP